MRRKIKYTLIGLMVLILGGTLTYYVWMDNTKAYSPEDTVTYQQGSLKMEVFYNRPYQKNRELFGGLVPYGEVWRTGANEATTFQVNKPIMVDGSLLEAGKYTLWTIPQENSWKVIFNQKMYTWGIDLTSEKAAREEAFDELIIERPVMRPQESVEQFTISFKAQQGLINLNLVWGTTKVSVPIKEAS